MEWPRHGVGSRLLLMLFSSRFHSLQDGAAHEQILKVIGSGLENSLSKLISQGKSEALWHYKIK